MPDRPPLRTPRAVSMWEFSWLVRRTGDEAEYADWDRVLDEAGERGLDCLRIDAFPHLVAAGRDGRLVERHVLEPQRKRFMWGNHTLVEVEPRKGLVEFIGKAHDRGIRIALSTWFNDDTLGRRRAVDSPAELTRIWTETLEFLDAEGLLGAIEWVDLCNEFPMAPWSPRAWEDVVRARWPGLRKLAGTWDPEQTARLQAWYAALDPLKERWPQLPYTFSMMFLGDRGVRAAAPHTFDIAEPHVWLSDDVRFSFRSAQLWVLLELPGAFALHRFLGPRVWRWFKKSWIRRLTRRLDVWAEWAAELPLPLYTSEGWSAINYEGRGSDWDWINEANEIAVDLAIERNWTGICTSNFAQPHFPEMWADVAWHRRMNDKIRNRTPDPAQ